MSKPVTLPFAWPHASKPSSSSTATLTTAFLFGPFSCPINSMGFRVSPVGSHMSTLPSACPVICMQQTRWSSHVLQVTLAQQLISSIKHITWTFSASGGGDMQDREPCCPKAGLCCTFRIFDPTICINSGTNCLSGSQHMLTRCLSTLPPVGPLAGPMLP